MSVQLNKLVFHWFVLFFLNADCKKKNKKIQVFVTAKRFYSAPDLQVLAKLVMGKNYYIVSKKQQSAGLF